MIAKIGSGISGYGGVIGYHEQKVEDGKATLVHSSFGVKDKRNIIYVLNELGMKNNHVQNKGHDISINFNPGDKISDSKAQIIIEDYLNGMGYNGHPYVLYKHSDKLHQHYHIVVSNIEKLGKYNQKMMGFYKYDSKHLSRELEIKYDLVPTIIDKENKSENLKSISSEKYTMQKAIIKGLKEENHKKEIERIIPHDIDIIKDKLIDNTLLKALIGEKKYQDLFMYLSKAELLKPSLKTELIKLLDQSLLDTQDYNSFMKEAKTKGLYVRHIKGDKTLVYGINNPEGEGLIYFKSNNLPERFRIPSLVKEENKQVHPIEKQRLFIKASVSRAIKRTNNLEAFTDYLRSRNIDVVLNSNTGGIQGISFISNNIKDAVQFKGTEIHREFSWNKIKLNFTNHSNTDLSNKETNNQSDKNLDKSIITIEKRELGNNIDPTFYLPILPNRKHYDDEDEDKGKSWKNKNKSR